jgi:hypothetical protein
VLGSLALNGPLAVASLSWSGVYYETVLGLTDGGDLWAVRQSGASCATATRTAASTGAGQSVAVSPAGVVFTTASGHVGRCDAALPFANCSDTAPSSVTVPGVAIDSTDQLFVSRPPALGRLTTALAGNWTGTASYALPRGPPALFSDARPVQAAQDGQIMGFNTGSATPVFTTQLRKPDNVATVAATPVTLGQNGAGAGATFQIYVGGGDSGLRAMDDAGNVVWNYSNNGSPLFTAPLLDCRGTVYYGGTGQVTALVTDSTGPANSAWPRFQHDNRNSGNLSSAVYLNGTCQE